MRVRADILLLQRMAAKQLLLFTEIFTEAPGSPTQELGLSEVVACEIVNVHLDSLFQHLLAFQFGRMSHAEFQSHLRRHASAMDEANDIFELAKRQTI